jgi:cellulose synthase/poly-beta-1,6-N-acetylglucosamine synthase-like glycosyltransferase
MTAETLAKDAGPRLSVVIPTRDRADLLARALESIAAQTLPREAFEVIVVDNGSSDDTAAVTARFAGAAGNIRYFFAPEPGLHVGRHVGLREARGEVIVYADDDIRALPTWLEAVAENFADPDVALVGGNNLPDFLQPPPPWLLKLWKRPFLGGHAIIPLSVIELPAGRRPFSPYFVWGCNFSVRRSVLLECGGFHPDGMPQSLIRFRGDGETQVSRLIVSRGLRCLFDSRASVLHAVTPERMTLDYFRKRAYNQGVSDSFTRLREGQAPAVRRGAAARLRRLAARAKAFLLSSPFDRDLRKLRRLEREGHAEGFAYHQNAYHNDPEVRAWVHRPDYF